MTFMYPGFKFIKGPCCLYPPVDDGDRVSFYELVKTGYFYISIPEQPKMTSPGSADGPITPQSIGEDRP
jgi:hypothetical protein